MDYSKEDVKKDINKDFQSLIQNLQNISNDINLNKDKNTILSQFYMILAGVSNLNKKVITEIEKSSNQDSAPSLIKNEKQIVTITTEDGEYIGEVKNGKPNGRGRLLYKGNLQGDIYEGEFKNGDPHGKGKYYHRNGNIYVGDFVNDKADGKGIFYCNNGDRYEGEFKQDLREGKGIFYFSDGDRMMGDYHRDKPIGKHVILQSNGTVIQKVYN